MGGYPGSGCSSYLADVSAEMVAEGESGLDWAHLLFRHGTTSASSQQAVQNFFFCPIFYRGKAVLFLEELSEKRTVF
jgi:hypothetical protein